MYEEVLVVDRIEDDVAICEDRNSGVIFIINISNLPEGTKEGTVLKYCDGEYVIDVEEQERIEKRIEDKMNDLWE